MPLKIIKDDITTLKVDAVVNAANRNLRQGGGVCGAIFEKAGAAALKAACDKIGGCPTGGAVITPGFALNAKYVIHAVGPLWINGFQGERKQLVSCYEKALALAAQNRVESVAFPLISSGIYGYPRDKAFQAAQETIRAFLEKRDMAVYLSVYDARAARPEPEIYAALLKHIASRGRDAALPKTEEVELPSLDDMIFEPDEAAAEPEPQSAAAEPFIRRALALAKEKGFSEGALCAAANMSRKALARLRNHPSDAPDRRSALSLCAALGLSADETKELLGSAGLFLSPDDRGDLIVDFFLRRGASVHEINAALYSFGEEQLFSL